MNGTIGRAEYLAALLALLLCSNNALATKIVWKIAGDYRNQEDCNACSPELARFFEEGGTFTGAITFHSDATPTVTSRTFYKFSDPRYGVRVNFGGVYDFNFNQNFEIGVSLAGSPLVGDAYDLYAEGDLGYFSLVYWYDTPEDIFSDTRLPLTLPPVPQANQVPASSHTWRLFFPDQPNPGANIDVTTSLRVTRVRYIPEPATLALVTLGLLMMAAFLRTSSSLSKRPGRLKQMR